MKDCCSRLEQDTPTDDENPLSGFPVCRHLDGDNAPHTLLHAPCGKKGHIMARPNKHESAVLKHRLSVRLSDTQYAVIKRYADQLGMSMAEYIRHQAVHGKVAISDPIVASISDIQNLTVEFSKIGSNLNQIAKYFNTGGMQSQTIREDINECIAELMTMSNQVSEMAGKFNGNTQTPYE